MGRRGGGRMGELPYKKDKGCLSYLLGVMKMLLVLLRMFSLKKPTVGTFTVPFRVFSPNNMTGDV